MYEFRETSPLLFSENWKQEIAKGNVGEFYTRQAQMKSEISAMRTAYQTANPRKKLSTHEMSILHVLANLNKCGLCAFQKFKDWGIEAVKLPLRGQNHRGNLAIVDLARKAIDEKNASPEFCKKIMGSPNFCSGQSCYYNYPYSK